MTRSARAAWTLIALAGCIALVTACGNPGSIAPSPPATGTASPTASQNPGASPLPLATATNPATSPGPSPCATSSLQVSVSASQGVAAGSSYYAIEFRNVSGASCTIYGYPGVSFVTGSGGRQIGIPATENPVHPRRLVTVPPGQAAHAELQVLNAQNYPPADCSMVAAHWLRVYPPNQTVPVYASFTAQACAKPRTVLTVETVQPGMTGA